MWMQNFEVGGIEFKYLVEIIGDRREGKVGSMVCRPPLQLSVGSTSCSEGLSFYWLCLDLPFLHIDLSYLEEQIMPFDKVS